MLRAAGDHQAGRRPGQPAQPGQTGSVSGLAQLQQAVRQHPVIGVLYGVDSLPALLGSDCRAAVVANIDLLLLPKALEVLTQQGILSIVNIDSIPGLAQDRGGVDYLQALGAVGVVSTRGSLMQRIQHAKLLAMQKVFVTDRSNLPRALDSVRTSHPDLVQVMPGPVVPRIDPEDLRVFEPFIVSGFVTDENDVRAALTAGAIGVTSHSTELWAATRSP
ncbi:transcriptional regulator [Enemella evansiae]|nr:transcriptional regulator [Enemella evansiae]OYO03967.1 transcriptional regulator [Enemella evansiae]OYO18203.1 transcriptional regulator [Enemella evansiae]